MPRLKDTYEKEIITKLMSKLSLKINTMYQNKQNYFEYGFRRRRI